MAANLSWYSARLLFVSEIHGDHERDRLCEESIIVVSGANEERARQAAEACATSMQHEYVNEQGETVQWRFEGLLELQDLCEVKIENGTEVWSRLFYESQATDPAIRDKIRSLATTVEESHNPDLETTQPLKNSVKSR